MTKLIIDVKDLNADWLAGIQQQYKNAQVEIIIHEPGAVREMTESRFWEIIDLLDWTKGDDDDAILQPAVTALQDCSVADIFRFQDILAEQLFALDGQAFAEQIGTRSFGGAQHFSVDTFLYARACVVANGQAFFHKVLENPSLMPKDFTFEPLLYLAGQAFEQRTGKEWEYLPRVSYETFSNRNGWSGKSWMDNL